VKGLYLLFVVNKDLDATKVIFIVKDNLIVEAMKSFSLKLKCIHCKNSFQMCPSKKILRQIYTIMFVGLHLLWPWRLFCKAKTRNSVLSTCTKGWPNKSFSNNRFSNQRSLVSRYSKVANNGERRDYHIQ